MKRLTFDEAWTKCLKQWRWIGKQIKAGDNRGIGVLKRVWLAENDPDAAPEASCYFCEYDAPHGGGRNDPCSRCPGVRIDATFSCMADGCDFRIEPLAFLRKLESLNRKRLAMKKNRKGRTK
jgi:hypothetical protein